MLAQETQQAIIERFGNTLRLRVSGICIQNEKILLIKHQYLGKGNYLWSPPGGGMYFGETAHQTLKREFAEETGLIIEVGKLLFVNEFLDPPLHAIELFFEVSIIGGTLKQGFDPELTSRNQIIQEVRFLSVTELQAEPQECLHSLLRNCTQVNDVLQKNGYLCTK
ncbi:MAG: NUDIX hydrolase [Microscillaceae bacterium]|nr:NUDIX hydrolase [Microscillaceae bacterium]MDW8459622.1 NUDIX hydrolase [Cytophagales bacterium]